MGIEFRLGRSDHKVVDDFLARRPEGVSGIWVEPHQTRIQQAVIETAKSVGLQVLIEPFTERLAAPGFTPRGLAYAERGPLDLERLGAGYGRDELVDAVAAAQEGVAWRTSRTVCTCGGAGYRPLRAGRRSQRIPGLLHLGADNG